ncbi:MAG: hypothetical protein ACR2NR_17470 [Solirubrobacteraceae bacterium]
MMMDYGGHMNTGGWVLTVLATLILVALAVGLVVWLVSSLTGRGVSGPVLRASAREILDRRLASGELTSEQYDALGEKLQDARPRRPRTSCPAAARRV